MTGNGSFFGCRMQFGECGCIFMFLDHMKNKKYDGCDKHIRHLENYKQKPERKPILQHSVTDIAGQKHWTDVITQREQYRGGGWLDIAFLREVGSHLCTERIAT